MKSECRVVVTNIQRMCMQDGPGIRTTVFFKGCNLHCPWCANPENLKFEPETYITADGCRGMYGREYDGDTLLQELWKDQKFWINSGGITFSGGEPLLQLNNLQGVLCKLKQKGVHIAIETALQTEEDKVMQCLSYIDLFIVDIKILEPLLCKKILGGNVIRFYNNLRLISEAGKEIIFRIPCNKEYVLQKNNWREIKKCISLYPQFDVEIFSVHTLARKKYESLGKRFQAFQEISISELEEVAKDLSSVVGKVRINSI